jgi:hypothetical protein
MEGAALASKSVNHHRYPEGDALTGAGYFLCGGGWEGKGKRGLGSSSGPRIVERGNLHCLLGNPLLGAVLTALKFPGLPEDLLKGFLAIGEGDPGVIVPVRAPEPDGEVSRHESSVRLLMIPAR